MHLDNGQERRPGHQLWSALAQGYGQGPRSGQERQLRRDASTHLGMRAGHVSVPVGMIEA